MRTALFALVAFALPATVAGANGSSAPFWPTAATLLGIVATLAALAGIAMKAGKWQQKVEHRLDQRDEALTALAERFGSVETAVAEGADSRRDIRSAVDALAGRFGSVETAVAEGADSRRDIRAAVDGLAERFEAGDAARQGIQDTLDNVARALNR